jgi:hypothetical protein
MLILLPDPVPVHPQHLILSSNSRYQFSCTLGHPSQSVLGTHLTWDYKDEFDLLVSQSNDVLGLGCQIEIRGKNPALL